MDFDETLFLMLLLRETGERPGDVEKALAKALVEIFREGNVSTYGEAAETTARLRNSIEALADYYFDAHRSEHLLEELSGMDGGVEVQEEMRDTVIDAMVYALRHGMALAHQAHGDDVEDDDEFEDNDLDDDELDDPSEDDDPEHGVVISMESECQEAHEPIAAETIPSFDALLRRPNQGFPEAPFYVEAEMCAPVLRNGTATRTLTVIPCFSRLQGEDVMEMFAELPLFHDLRLLRRPPSIEPNVFHIVLTAERLPDLFGDDKAR